MDGLCEEYIGKDRDIKLLCGLCINFIWITVWLELLHRTQRS